MNNNNLIHTLSLWTELNTVAEKGHKICDLISPIQPTNTPCEYAKECHECFFAIKYETQDKTIESLDRHTGWKL